MGLSERFRGALAICCYSVVVAWLAVSAIAQSRAPQQHFDEIRNEARLTAVEANVASIKEGIKEMREENQTWFRVVMTILGALGLERGADRFATARRRKPEPEQAG